MFKVFEETPF